MGHEWLGRSHTHVKQAALCRGNPSIYKEPQTTLSTKSSEKYDPVVGNPAAVTRNKHVWHTYSWWARVSAGSHDEEYDDK